MQWRNFPNQIERLFVQVAVVEGSPVLHPELELVRGGPQARPAARVQAQDEVALLL